MSKGYVFRDKQNQVYLIKCPECGLENYSLNVASGICSWCGYKATLSDVKGKENETKQDN